MKKLLASLAFLLVSTVNAQTTNLNVALDWYINPDQAPLLVAQSYGYFAKQGLNVKFIEPSSTESARNLVLSHQADIGIDYQPEMMMAINQGMPLKVFANLIPVPLSCMAVLSNSGIDSIKDLSGKTIAYSGDPLEQSLINAELQYNKVDPKSVHLLAVNMDLSQVLLSKKVDAVNGFMRNVEPVELKMQGVDTRLFYPEANGVPTYAELVLFTNASNINKQTLQKFMTALNQGEATLKADPQAAWTKVVAAYPQDLASSSAIKAANAKIWQATVPYFTENMQSLSHHDYAAFNKFLLSNNLIQQKLPLNQYWYQEKL